MTWIEYSRKWGDPTSYEAIGFDEWDEAKHWTLHLPLPRDESGHWMLSEIARTGCEALTGEYLVQPSWVQWGEPEPLTEDEPQHLAVYFNADGARKAHRIGNHLADVLGFHKAERCVSTAADWAEQTWRAVPTWDGVSLLTEEGNASWTRNLGCGCVLDDTQTLITCEEHRE